MFPGHTPDSEFQNLVSSRTISSLCHIVIYHLSSSFSSINNFVFDATRNIPSFIALIERFSSFDSEPLPDSAITHGTSTVSDELSFRRLKFYQTVPRNVIAVYSDGEWNTGRCYLFRQTISFYRKIIILCRFVIHQNS